MSAENLKYGRADPNNLFLQDIVIKGLNQGGQRY